MAGDSCAPRKYGVTQNDKSHASGNGRIAQKGTSRSTNYYRHTQNFKPFLLYRHSFLIKLLKYR